MSGGFLEIFDGEGIVINAELVIRAAAIVTALTVLVTVVVRVIHYFMSRTKRISALEEKTDELEKVIRTDREENKLLMEGMLACLDGLEQQGCNHIVTETKNKLKEYMNQRAHA